MIRQTKLTEFRLYKLPYGGCFVDTNTLEFKLSKYFGVIILKQAPPVTPSVVSLEMKFNSMPEPLR